MTATASTPVASLPAVTDSKGRVIERDTLVSTKDFPVAVVVRTDKRSNRVLLAVEVDGETQHFARKAHTATAFRAHGRMVKASKAAELRAKLGV